MKLKNPSILYDLKLLKRRFHLCGSTFSLLLKYVANHQLTIVAKETIAFLTKCKNYNIFPLFIHNAVSHLSYYRHEHVRSTVKRLKGYLLDAALAEQKQRRNHCIRTIVQLRAALHQRMSADCWRRMIDRHKAICDILRVEARNRLEQKFNKLRHVSSTSDNGSKYSVPPNRCIVLDSELVDEEVVQMLNLGPNFAPQPVFSDEARINVTTALCKFGYSYSWRKHMGATAHTLQESLRLSMPFPRSQVSLPTYDARLCVELKELIYNVLRAFDKHRSKGTVDNMTCSERHGLRKALRLKSSLRFSVGDKCGGFVVMSKERDTALCQAVLSDTTTYRTTSIGNYNQQCGKIRDTMKRILGPKMDAATLTRLVPKHPTVPTFYQLVKTHKLKDFEESADLCHIRTRPIVSSCGGPTDGLSWLLQRILSPLLIHVPAHLRNVEHSLHNLSEAQIPDEPRLSYQSFDVSALYTNVDTTTAVEACVDLLKKHHMDCPLYGLPIADIKELLIVVVNFNIFQFKNQLYQQTRGLAMGNRIAPLLAIFFMDHLEKQSLTSGILFYARYIDDIFIVGKSRTALRQTFAKLNSAHCSITLTTEDPDEDGFIPYLNTRVKLAEGEVLSMWYKKPASKNILLHSRSCHLRFMKLNVVKNVVATARKVTTTNMSRVMEEVERILNENGYKADDIQHSNSWRPFQQPGGIPLKIVFLSESFALEVNRIVKRSKLPIRLISVPPPTLKQLLTTSRPYEKRCRRDNCDICGDDQEICLLQGTVYRIQCVACSELYIGESGRPLHKRMDEHLRALKNPSSYPDNPFSRHRTKQHTTDAAPKLNVSLDLAQEPQRSC